MSKWLLNNYKYFKTFRIYFLSIFDGPNIQSTWHFGSSTALSSSANITARVCKYKKEKTLPAAQNTRHAQDSGVNRLLTAVRSVSRTPILIWFSPSGCLYNCCLNEPNWLGNTPRVQMKWTEGWIRESTVTSGSRKEVRRTTGATPSRPCRNRKHTDEDRLLYRC